MQETLVFDKERQQLYGLFHDIQHLRKSDQYFKYLHFLCRFKTYSAFNVSLVYLQKPKTSYFATRLHWERAFNRQVKEEARPLVILRPMGPVMFVYDLADTVGDDEAITEELKNPFKVRGSIQDISFKKITSILQNLYIELDWKTEMMQSGDEFVGYIKRLIKKQRGFA